MFIVISMFVTFYRATDREGEREGGTNPDAVVNERNTSDGITENKIVSGRERCKGRRGQEKQREAMESLSLILNLRARDAS